MAHRVKNPFREPSEFDALIRATAGGPDEVPRVTH